MQADIAEKLITLGHQIAGKKLRAFIDGSVSLKPKPLNLKGRAGWDSKLTPQAHPIHKECKDTARTSSANVGSQNEDGEVFLPTYFACPGCQAPQLSTQAAFQLKDLDKPTRCKNCKMFNKVGRWLCKCHLPWHLCTQHVHSCRAHRNANSNDHQPPVLPRTSVKRIAPMTYEQLQAFDNTRAAKERRRNLTEPSRCHTPARILPPQSNILSQKLRERFASLLAK